MKETLLRERTIDGLCEPKSSDHPPLGLSKIGTPKWPRLRTTANAGLNPKAC